MISLFAQIQDAQPENLSDIYRIFKACAEHMNSNGIAQWDDEYPNKKQIQKFSEY